MLGEPALDVEISYVIRATNQSRNLVFPFYVLPDESRSMAAIETTEGRS